MKARFTDLEEFLEEMRLDGPADDVVRVTVRYAPWPECPSISNVSILAGFVNRAGQLVELQRYLGKDWGKDSPESTETQLRVNQYREQLLQAIDVAGLVARSGCFEE